MKDEVEKLLEEFSEDLNNNEPNAWLKLEEDILALLSKSQVEAVRATEKAFGGCKKCYGKGYATARIGTSSRYGNVTHDTVIPCTCDRGKQFANLKEDGETK